MFEITEKDFKAFVETYVENVYPLKLKGIPAKEKRKYIILCIVIHYFELNKIYHEKEVNAILEPMMNDHVMIRRYLIDYGFMDRTDDGKSYWLVKDPKDFQTFKLS
ncbi:MAG: DUF2087 domain-containing protein [Acholeplasmataceae bacterium]|jgi:hypothetical protein|nr:DUF2087 domain-containing protein [Acholeplasmataceae bacterium]